MITIQGFARLCGCNTQTLRYYDRIGLLAPARVDEWTGYRYYEEEQAMLFVKIKNLQQADFSIEEIKALLPGDDDLLMAAFEQKISEQKQKLATIRKIQRSYLREAMDMRNMVNEYMDFVEGRMAKPELWEELGLSAAQEAETRANVNAMLADWMSQCRNASEEISRQMSSQDLAVMKEVMEKLKEGNPDRNSLIMSVAGGTDTPEEEIPEGAQSIFERSGWEHVSEWIKDIPESAGNGKKSFFLFKVKEGSPVSDPGFPTLMLAVMAFRYNAMNGGMSCRIGLSNDGQNHFALLQK